jgi:O-antigen ligase
MFNHLKSYFINNNQFIFIGIVWVLVGMYAGPVIYVVLPLMLFLLNSKKMNLEILLGFFLILTLSDSRLNSLKFAADAKNIYIVVLSLFSFKEMRSQNISVDFYKYFIAFFFISILTVFFNPNIILSFQKTLSYILFFTFLPNYLFIVYKQYGTLVFKSIVYFVALILALGIIFNYINPGITNLVGRFRGLLGNPNGLGLYTFLFILLFTIINEHVKDLFSRSEKIVIYGLALFCLLKCGARTSLVSVLMFLFFVRFYKISSLLGFVIFVFSVIIYQLVSDNLVSIIISLGLGDQFRVETLESGSGRIIAWKFAWDQIQDNFYLGKGFSYTEYIFKQNYDYLSRLGHQGAAHNAYLTIWLDTGLIGLLLYLIGLLMTFLKAAKRSKLAIPMLYSVLFSNYYESWITASLNPFTIQLVFMITIIFIYDFKDNAKSTENLNEALPSGIATI